VVKPLQSAGSEDVYLCNSRAEAEAAFSRILGKVDGLGDVNEEVLIQEFLFGREFAIDKVSRDGVHKICAVWEYDKKCVNGSPFVYYGRCLRDSKLPEIRESILYGDKVLDALEIRNGASHMEVIYNDLTGPCLVEVGARCHGGEGEWMPITEECVGYTQVCACVYACVLAPHSVDQMKSLDVFFNIQSKSTW
jgi:biotin carboxylase